jgi:hypothetical protein
LNSGPIPWATLPDLFFFVMGFEIESHELFAQAGFKPWSSWSLPPEWLGLQAWATSPRLERFILAHSFRGFSCLALHLSRTSGRQHRVVEGLFTSLWIGRKENGVKEETRASCTSPVTYLSPHRPCILQFTTSQPCHHIIAIKGRIYSLPQSPNDLIVSRNSLTDTPRSALLISLALLNQSSWQSRLTIT